MIATNIKTLRQAVITLLRQAGKSPIEAVDLWDRIYSREIQAARPGAHRLIIGSYELEYTKPNTPSPIDLGGLIEQSNALAHDEAASYVGAFIRAGAIIVIVAAIIIWLL